MREVHRQQGHWRRGKRSSRCQSRDSPAARGADPGEVGCALQPVEVHGGADLHLQPVETPHQSRWVPEGGCDPMGSSCWSRLPPGPVAPWREEPTLDQVCWQGLWTHGGPTLEQPVPEALHPWVGPTPDSLWRTVSNGRDPTLGQGQRLRSPPLRRKERQRQSVMNWSQPPFPVALLCSGGGGTESGVKFSPGKREGWGGEGEGVFKIWFYFSLSYSDFLVINWTFFPKFNLVCPWQ